MVAATTWRPRLTTATVFGLFRAGGGGLLVASLGGAWTTTGPGSTLSSREFADLLLGGSIQALVPPLAGLAFYLVGLGGAILLTAEGLRWGRRPVRFLTVIAWSAWLIAAFATAAVVLALARLPLKQPGIGALAAGSGLTLTLVGLSGDRGHRRRPA